jgi:hypothetical protein
MPAEDFELLAAPVLPTAFEAPLAGDLLAVFPADLAAVLADAFVAAFVGAFAAAFAVVFVVLAAADFAALGAAAFLAGAFFAETLVAVFAICNSLWLNTSVTNDRMGKVVQVERPKTALSTNMCGFYATIRIFDVSSVTRAPFWC